MTKLKGTTLSTPLSIISLVILVIIGVYLAFTLQQSNQIIETNQSNTSLPSQPSSISSTPDETTDSSPEASVQEDWQTFTNEKFHYTLNYPKSFSLVNGLYDKISGKRVNQDEWVFIDKEVIGEQTYLASSDWPQPYLQISSYDKVIDLSEKNTQETVYSNLRFAEEDAQKIRLVEPSAFDGNYYGEISFNHKNKGFRISWLNSDAQGNHDSEVDQILATFKFTP